MGSKENPGMVPRGLKYLFDCIPERYEFKANFCEIYNETFIDLLKGEKIEKIVNLETIAIESPTQFSEVLQKVNDRRKKTETNRNRGSSRSHCVIQIEVKGTFANEEDRIVKSKVVFLDFAGCENSNDHLENIGGTTQIEMSNINKSVNNFQRVIDSLKNKDPAPDFRSSKLTHLLKP